MSEVRRIRRRLKKQGFELHEGKRHTKVRRSGRMVAILPHGAKISDSSLRNVLARLKREGYEP